MYPGYYFTGDGGYFDKDGYLYVMGQVDDVINEPVTVFRRGP